MIVVNLLVLLLLLYELSLISRAISLLGSSVHAISHLTRIVPLGERNQSLEQLENLRLVHHVQIKGAVGLLLSLVVSVVHLISLLLVHDLSDLLQLVIVDKQVLSIERIGLGLLLCVSSRVRALKADESEDRLVFLSVELDGFNLTEAREVLTQLIFSGGRREVLNVEIASLL